MGRGNLKGAVAYLRVSGRGQIGGHGLTRQREKIAAYARRRGLRILETFTDAGVSGAKGLKGRRGLAALLDHIESNGVRVVLVESASRLARDLMVQEVILAQLRALGVSVIAADGGQELTVSDGNPTRKMVRQILGAVSEFDKAVTVLKLRAARERIRRQKGRCEGRKPYGTRPGEKAILERMKQLRRKPRGRERMSYAAIADALTREGYLSRTGKPWQASSVQSILKRN